MYLSEDYVSGQLHRAAQQRMLRDLERRRVIAERAAEDAAAADGVTDAARPRRGIRALLPRRLGPLSPARPVMP
jgi:hypothetical protein